VCALRLDRFVGDRFGFEDELQIHLFGQVVVDYVGRSHLDHLEFVYLLLVVQQHQEILFLCQQRPDLFYAVDLCLFGVGVAVQGEGKTIHVVEGD
jgi:hypothetical protein